MRIVIAADHNGIEAEGDLLVWLVDRGHRVQVQDHDDPDEVVDYPPLCAHACAQVLTWRADRAIVIGGAGGGEMIACNRLPGIRAALGQTPEVARISRANNDANVLVLGAKVLSIAAMRDIVAVWLDTPFSGGRHQARLDQVEALARGELLT